MYEIKKYIISKESSGKILFQCGVWGRGLVVLSNVQMNCSLQPKERRTNQIIGSKLYKQKSMYFYRLLKNTGFAHNLL